MSDHTAHLVGKGLVVDLQAVQVDAPTADELGIVHRLLDLGGRGAEQLGGLGVEEGAVPAPGDRGDGHAHELLVLVGDQRLPELHPLDKVPLGVDVVVRDLVDERDHRAERLLHLVVDVLPAHGTLLLVGAASQPVGAKV